MPSARRLLLYGLLGVTVAACATSGRTGTRSDSRVGDGAASADGAGPDASGADGGSCFGSELLCDGDCVDSQSDPAHCGGCNVACPADGNCTAGVCVVHLSGTLSGLVSRPNATVRLSSDVEVAAYNGSDDITQCDPGETGCLVIEARIIVVEAGVTVLGAGRGYGGGGGGGGGAGSTGPSGNCSGCTSCSAGGGGPGIAAGQPGDPGAVGPSSSISGAGGAGGGPFGGAGGASRVRADNDGDQAGASGAAGGYAAPGGNGDASTDESLRLGSGGGGGSGGACAVEAFYSSVGGSGGGGAGNRGGASVKLVASERVEVHGVVSTAGLAAATGNGGNGTDGQWNNLTCDLGGSGGAGGSAWEAGASSGGSGVPGYFQAGYNSCIDRQCEDYGSHAVSGANGGAGGPGAGGGVLLKAPVVLLEGSIDASGGQSSVNGGTVKIFHQGIAPPTAAISAGRIHLQPY